jgi:hypothetical protein
VNWWLMAVAFVLGAVLTAVFVLRRVPTAAPVTESHGPARPKLEPGGVTSASASSSAASKFTSDGDDEDVERR